jgi:hypothetical protein
LGSALKPWAFDVLVALRSSGDNKITVVDHAIVTG